MFQMTFAIITPALVVGAFAERMRFCAMLLFTVLWLLLVYVPVAHWVWGGGWLRKMGVMDFAGGIVVHINAGVAALVARWSSAGAAASRKSRCRRTTLPMTVTGAGMLWVGWFGFNGGSALAANGSAGMAMLATHTGAAAGALRLDAHRVVALRQAQRARHRHRHGRRPRHHHAGLRLRRPAGRAGHRLHRRRRLLLRRRSS